MLYSIDVEQQLLATIIQHPKSFFIISDFITHQDFFSVESKVNSTVFSVVKGIIESGGSPDPVLVASKIKSLGISFAENLSIGDYIHSLRMRKTSSDSIESLAKELKLYTVRREISYACKEVSDHMKKLPSTTPYDDIIRDADRIFNNKINLFESGSSIPENIYDEMERLIEELGNNPIENFGFMGPFGRVNDIYGSLLRAGNITIFVARSAVGKTALCMNFATKVGAKYKVPILHFDNGEMSKEELIHRQCAALSHTPIGLIETGKWRNAGPDVVKRVRDTWKIIQDMEFYYFNVGGMDVDAMLMVLKRFYYSIVGRGNPMIFSFDYIKTSYEPSGYKKEYEIVGQMLDKFKKTIEKDILHDGKPVISMMTSVQSNRQGIVANRNAAEVRDDESVVSLSDRLQHFCSHMFILREKTLDEILDEGEQFGTHKLINIKARHLGKDINGHLRPVRVGDALRRNFINLEFKNFDITEKGDLRDIVAFRNAHAELIEGGEDNEDIPDFN